jgi:hypothetical protein
MNVCELTFGVSHPSRVPQDEAHRGCCDEFMEDLGYRLPVKFGLLNRCLRMM